MLGLEFNLSKRDAFRLSISFNFSNSIFHGIQGLNITLLRIKFES